jgi:hypothetical protein
MAPTRAAAAITGVLSASGSWSASASASTRVAIAPGTTLDTRVSLTARAADAALWWPLGLGPQPRYNVTVSFTPDDAAAAAVDAAPRAVGFRVVHLVTTNSTAANGGGPDGDGSGNFTMRLRVSGSVWRCCGGD